MVKDNKFSIRKRKTKDFLLENILTKPTQEKDKLLFKKNNQTFEINIISQEKEFKKLLGYRVFDNSYELDNDRDNLIEMFKSLISYTINQNNNGKIPGFIFSQAETDFSQVPLNKRKETIVNKMGFNKQLLQTTYSPLPFKDTRILTRTEIVAWTLHQQVKEIKQQNPIHIKYKGDYFRELNYFNVNKELVEVDWFKNLVNPKVYKTLTKCMVCDFEETWADHKDCKSEKEYKEYVIKRTKARYHKNMTIKKSRQIVDFYPAQLNMSLLEKYVQPFTDIQNRPYYVALIK